MWTPRWTCRATGLFVIASANRLVSILNLESSVGKTYGSREGKNSVKWTRLSRHDFVDNPVRLQLFALAYNAGNFLRRPALWRGHAGPVAEPLLTSSVKRTRINGNQPVMVASGSILGNVGRGEDGFDSKNNRQMSANSSDRHPDLRRPSRRGSGRAESPLVAPLRICSLKGSPSHGWFFFGRNGQCNRQ